MYFCHAIKMLGSVMVILTFRTYKWDLQLREPCKSLGHGQAYVFKV